MVLTKRLPDKTSKPVCLKKMSYKSVLTKCLPDKTSADLPTTNQTWRPSCAHQSNI